MVIKLVTWECNILKRTNKLLKNFWKQRGILVWNQKLMWEEKAYLVTANTHSFLPSPLETPLTLCLSLHTLLLAYIHAEGPLLIFSKHLDHEQLSRWLAHHPRFMQVNYTHDIGKLKGIIISCIINIHIHSLIFTTACRCQNKWWCISEPGRRLTGALWIVYWIPNTTDENYWGSGMLLIIISSECLYYQLPVFSLNIIYYVL